MTQMYFKEGPKLIKLKQKYLYFPYVCDFKMV